MQVREHARRKSDQSDATLVENQTVFIVDDDAAVREAISMLLGSVDLRA